MNAAATSHDRLAQLQEHSEFVSRLAHALVRDAASADDLIQETWIAALRQREPLKSPRAWLSTVLKNFARDQHRRDARRKAREEKRSTPPQVEPPDEMSERFETSRMLAEQVSRLEEPYRRTVLLHYFDGQTLAEIAREEGIPSATVRWRLRRGLEILRTQLDQQHGGDRRTWCLAMVPLAVRRSKGAGVSSSVLVAATLLVLVGGVALWGAGLWGSGETNGSAQRQGSTGASNSTPQMAAAPESAEPPSSTEESVEGSVQREVEDATPAPELPAPVPTPRATARSAGLEGQFVDSQGQPIAGVRLTPTDVGAGPIVQLMVNNLFPNLPSTAEGMLQIDVKASAKALERLSALSGAKIESTIRLGFRADHPDFESTIFSVTLVDGERVNFGRKVLLQPTFLEGRVLGADGTPLGGANVAVTSPPFPARSSSAKNRGPLYAEYRATTDSNGEYRIRSPRGMVRVWAGSKSHRFAWTHAQMDEGQTQQLPDLQLEASPESDHSYTLSGVVTDPQGVPVPSARVSVRSSTSTTLKSAGAAGEFEVSFTDRSDRRDRVTVWASDPDSQWGIARATWDDPAEGTHLRVALRDPETLRVIVEGPSDTQFTEAKVYWSSGIQRVWGRPVAGRVGVFEISRPIDELPLTVEVPGFVKASISGEAEELPEEVRVTLHPRVGVPGRVVAAGEPVVGASLILLRLGEGRRGLVNGFFTRFEPRWGSYDLKSDDDGRFEFFPEDEGRYAILVTNDGYASTLSEEFEFRFSDSTRPLELELSQGGVVEGHVKAFDVQVPVSGTVVGLNSFDGRPRTVRVGPDGYFRFDHVRPGPWTVSVRQEVVDPTTGIAATHSDLVAPESNVWVEEGAVEVVEVVLDRVQVEGQFGGLDSYEGWTWRLEDPRNLEILAEGAVGPEGQWSARLAFEQEVSLELRAPGGEFGNFNWKQLRRLEAGEMSWEVELSLKPLSGSLDRPSEVRGSLALVGPLAQGEYRIVIEPDAQGRFSVPFAPTDVAGVELTMGFLREGRLQEEGVDWTPDGERR